MHNRNFVFVECQILIELHVSFLLYVKVKFEVLKYIWCLCNDKFNRSLFIEYYIECIDLISDIFIIESKREVNLK